MGKVNRYSKRADGDKALAKNFLVKEFACQDGSDAILIDSDLPVVLQKIRDHFGAPVTLNSAYRTPTHNAKVGGVSNSQHVKGTAADIAVQGIAPESVAQYAEFLMPKTGGIGLYPGFVHVDVRSIRARWDNRSGKEVGVSGFPGYTESANKKEPWYQTHVDWAIAEGITADGARPKDPVTRAELWATLHEYDKKLHAGK